MQTVETRHALSAQKCNVFLAAQKYNALYQNGWFNIDEK